MAAGNSSLYRAACEAVGRMDLFEDPRFATTQLRAKNQEALRDILEEEFKAHDSEEWLARFRKAGVPCAPINTYSQALADPQVAHMGWVQPLTLPTGATTKTFVSPLRFSGQGGTIDRPPPGLGEHNDEIFGQD
jgi:crotonobetainyl-CoA:carnitine CoA-transferase CaiB-like acyl-CoA transferase